jgi:26S proteasome regulatory subunit N12
MTAIGDVGITIRKATELFRSFKAAYDAKDDLIALERLGALKKVMVFIPTFLDPTVTSPTRTQEIVLVRETLEHAVLLSARRKDMDEFDLYYSQLYVYYNDFSEPTVPQSTIFHLIQGLNLVRLLVGNRIAEFHTELEKIPNAEHRNPYILFAVQLERYLMEGSYNKLLHARRQSPSNEYMPVLELLEGTVRQDVMHCIPRSYPELSLADAQAMLMLKSADELRGMAAKADWSTNPSGTHFVFEKVDGHGKKELNFMDLLRQDIAFAAELQRVV